MELFIDFESRSPLDIKKCGAYAYAEHPDTEVLCLAVKVDDGDTDIWVPLEFDFRGAALANFRLRELIEAADHIHAHNAGFERCMWTEHMVKRRGFPEIPISKWDDTAARAAMCALPRSLDGACKALGVSQQKDAEGYKLMLKMCRPRALRKKERDTLAAELGMTEEEVKSEAKAILSALKCDPRAPGKLRPDYHRFFAWHESADDLVRLCRYCIQDVEAEYALAQELPPLPKMERRIWELDQTINDRGILCDLVSVEHAEAIIEAHEEKLLDELRGLTGLSSAKAVAALKGWLKDNDCGVEDLTKQSVGDALKGDLSPEARRVLEIRQSLGKSSTAKLAAFKAYACKDGRLRGMMLYHGAATGRWAGRGPQPHNLPRGDEIIAHLQDQSIALYPVRDPGLLDAVMGEPLNVISSCLRGMLVAAPGHDLIAADYSAIEARGLAYLAGEETVLDAFRNNLDLYKVAASGIYKKPYEQITKTERSVGKTCVLACGYGGSKGAMLAFGADRLGMSDEEIDSAVAAWRESNPNIVRFWYALTEACAKTVKEGVETRYRQIGFRMRGKFLQMILPSGRPLWYYAPRVQQVRMPWGKDKEMVTAMTVDSLTKQWVRRPLGHPILSENATQAFCRDLLALGLIRCEAAGYRPVLHVHDEIVAEVPEGWGSVEEMEAIMSEVPKWAEGMPISAEGYRAKRYRK